MAEVAEVVSAMEAGLTAVLGSSEEPRVRIADHPEFGEVLEVDVRLLVGGVQGYSPGALSTFDAPAEQIAAQTIAQILVGLSLDMVQMAERLSEVTPDVISGLLARDDSAEPDELETDS